MRKYKKLTEDKLASILFNRWAKRNGNQWGKDWESPKPDAVRLSWLDTAADVLKLAKQNRLPTGATHDR